MARSAMPAHPTAGGAGQRLNGTKFRLDVIACQC
jgi:hypothetical protein